MYFRQKGMKKFGVLKKYPYICRRDMKMKEGICGLQLFSY